MSDEVIEKKEVVKKQRDPLVKNIIRYLSKSGITGELADSAADVDAYVGSFVEKGYTLVGTHFLEQNPEGYGVLYILQKK